MGKGEGKGKAKGGHESASMFADVFTTNVSVGGTRAKPDASRRQTSAFEPSSDGAAGLSRIHRGGDSVADVLDQIDEPVVSTVQVRKEDTGVVQMEGVKPAILSQRVLAAQKPWARDVEMDVEGALDAVGAPTDIQSFPPVEAFDDEEYELRGATAWLQPHEEVRAAAAAAEEAAAAATKAAAAVETLGGDKASEEFAPLMVEMEAKAEDAEKAQEAAAEAAVTGRVGATFLQLDKVPYSIRSCLVQEYDT